MVRKAGLEPASLSALAPKASVFAISPLPHCPNLIPDFRPVTLVFDANFFALDDMAPCRIQEKRALDPRQTPSPGALTVDSKYLITPEFT